MTSTEALDQICCGIDLHASNVYLVILDPKGNRIYSRRHPNKLDVILKTLREHPDLKHIAVESTYNLYWLVDGLQEAGYEVHLANPAAMKDCAAPKFTGDKHDAQRLAYLLQRGDLPEGYIYPKEIRAVRDVLRRRLMLVRQRTQIILSLQALYARTTGKTVSGKKVKTWTHQDIERFVHSDADRFSAVELLDSLMALEKRVKRMDEYVRKFAKLAPGYETLLKMPGVGLALSMTILLETGPIERFDNAGQYASYCRTVPSRKKSNGKEKGQNNRKNGNKYLSWAWVEAAQFAQQHHPKIQRWFQKKMRRTCRNIALKSLASKLSKASYHMRRDEVDFNEQLLFG